MIAVAYTTRTGWNSDSLFLNSGDGAEGIGNIAFDYNRSWMLETMALQVGVSFCDEALKLACLWFCHRCILLCSLFRVDLEPKCMDWMGKRWKLRLSKPVGLLQWEFKIRSSCLRCRPLMWTIRCCSQISGSRAESAFQKYHRFVINEISWTSSISRLMSWPCQNFDFCSLSRDSILQVSFLSSYQPWQSNFHSALHLNETASLLSSVYEISMDSSIHNNFIFNLKLKILGAQIG